MRIGEIEFIDQRMLTLVVDIAKLLEECQRHEDTPAEGCFARAAVTNTALLLECVANSCLASLSLPSKLGEELDRLPSVAKLDYYLCYRSSKHIDRGCRETQLAVEVLRLRDHIVHPKPKPGVHVGDGEKAHVDYGCTKALGIPFDTRNWVLVDGVKVAEAATSFLQSFFVDWCGLGKGSVTRVLACRERGLIAREVDMWVLVPSGELEQIQKWLPFVLRFIDLRPSDA